jgi:hypothetical protein
MEEDEPEWKQEMMTPESLHLFFEQNNLYHLFDTTTNTVVVNEYGWTHYGKNHNKEGIPTNCWAIRFKRDYGIWIGFR